MNKPISFLAQDIGTIKAANIYIFGTKYQAMFANIFSIIGTASIHVAKKKQNCHAQEQQKTWLKSQTSKKKLINWHICDIENSNSGNDSDIGQHLQFLKCSVLSSGCWSNSNIRKKFDITKGPNLFVSNNIRYLFGRRSEYIC